MTTGRSRHGRLRCYFCFLLPRWAHSCSVAQCGESSCRKAWRCTDDSRRREPGGLSRSIGSGVRCRIRLVWSENASETDTPTNVQQTRPPHAQPVQMQMDGTAGLDQEQQSDDDKPDYLNIAATVSAMGQYLGAVSSDKDQLVGYRLIEFCANRILGVSPEFSKKAEAQILRELRYGDLFDAAKSLKRTVRRKRGADQIIPSDEQSAEWPPPDSSIEKEPVTVIDSELQKKKRRGVRDRKCCMECGTCNGTEGPWTRIPPFPESLMTVKQCASRKAGSNSDVWRCSDGRATLTRRIRTFGISRTFVSVGDTSWREFPNHSGISHLTMASSRAGWKSSSFSQMQVQSLLLQQSTKARE